MKKTKKSEFRRSVSLLLLRVFLSRGGKSGLFSLWLIFSMIGPTGQSRFVLEERLLMNAGWVLLVVSVVVLLTPYFMYSFSVRNWPIAWSVSASTLVGAFLAVLISAFTVYLPERMLIASAETFLGVGGMLAFIVPVFFYTHQSELIYLCKEVTGNSVGWYVRKPIPVNEIFKDLPPDKRGTLIKMRTQGGYVDVQTSKGSLLLHGSLKSLCEKIPPSVGVRVHRSIWINWEQIEELQYKKGNPHILTKEGDSLPVSRKVVDQIKQHLNA